MLSTHCLHLLSYSVTWRTCLWQLALSSPICSALVLSVATTSHCCPLLGPGCRRTFLAGGWESSQLSTAGGDGDFARAGVLPARNRNRVCSRRSVVVQTFLHRWFNWLEGSLIGVRDTAVTLGVVELPCCWPKMPGLGSNLQAGSIWVLMQPLSDRQRGFTISLTASSLLPPCCWRARGLVWDGWWRQAEPALLDTALGCVCSSPSPGHHLLVWTFNKTYC